MISALAWIKKGAAAPLPEKQDLTDQEFIRIQEQLGTQLALANQDLEEAQENQNSDEEMEDISEKDKTDLSIYNLDTYDDEPEQNTLFSNIKGLAYYENNSEDPYIELDDKFEQDQELEEMRIEETDNLLLACKTEDDISHLEVYLYEEQEDNLYVHHDILLPSFPLCVEWLDFCVGRKSGQAKGLFYFNEGIMLR
jgi:periodic tryptophan protein 1